MPKFSDYSPNLSKKLTAGECNIPRLLATSAVQSGSGTLGLGFFTAELTETITSVRMITNSTASATITLQRIGIYSVDGNGDGTLVASTANDTSLFIATNTAYTKSLSASWSKTAGSRYAVGVLVVATTVASFVGAAHSAQATNTAVNTEWGLAPRLMGALSSQTDLPASFTDASLTPVARVHYMAFLR